MSSLTVVGIVFLMMGVVLFMATAGLGLWGTVRYAAWLEHQTRYRYLPSGEEALEGANQMVLLHAAAHDLVMSVIEGWNASVGRDGEWAAHLNRERVGELARLTLERVDLARPSVGQPLRKGTFALDRLPDHQALVLREVAGHWHTGRRDSQQAHDELTRWMHTTLVEAVEGQPERQAEVDAALDRLKVLADSLAAWSVAGGPLPERVRYEAVNTHRQLFPGWNLRGWTPGLPVLLPLIVSLYGGGALLTVFSLLAWAMFTEWMM